MYCGPFTMTVRIPLDLLLGWNYAWWEEGMRESSGKEELLFLPLVHKVAQEIMFYLQLKFSP